MTIFAQDGANGFIIPVKTYLTSTGPDTPVSYTHLDVYKRQIISLIPADFGCAVPGTVIYNHIIQIRKAPDQVLHHPFYILFLIKSRYHQQYLIHVRLLHPPDAVSYTHLQWKFRFPWALQLPQRVLAARTAMRL